jgi:hypothetical protein
MEYKKLSISSLTKPIEVKKVTVIWGNDGWRYIPQLKLRQKFTETLFIQEEWDGVIAIPENVETINRQVYSLSPLVWREKGSQFDEAYGII